MRLRRDEMFKFIWKGMDMAHKLDETPSVCRDKEFKKHYHDFYEIFFFISGTAMYTVEDEKRPLKKCDALIIKPGQFHHVEFLDDSRYERYVLKLPATFVPQYIADKLEGRSAFYVCHPEALEMLQRLDEAYAAYSGDDLYYFAGSLACQLLVYLTATDHTERQNKNLATEDITNVLQYITEHIEQSLTMTDIADNFGYSPDYLSRRFFNYMGTPIMKYVRTKRILAAQKMLAKGTKPTRVAEMLNFSDYSTFYRAYMSVTGKAPSAVRPADNNA